MHPSQLRLTVALIAAFVALGATSGPATAGGGCDGASVVEHIFDTADTDGSGTLSPAEYESAGLTRFGVTFEEGDLDGDGEIGIAEYLTLYELHHPPRGAAEV